MGMEFYISKRHRQMMGEISQDMYLIQKWCYENMWNLDLKQEKQYYCCEIFKKYLMNQKLGKWTEKDTSFIILYDVAEYLMLTGITQNIKVKLLTDEQIEKEFPNKRNFLAMFKASEDESCLYYAVTKLVPYFKTEKFLDLVDGINAIYHELTHAIVYEILIGNHPKTNRPSLKTLYHLTIERMANFRNIKIYNDFYNEMLGEAHANLAGYEYALQDIKIYNPEFYKKSVQEQDVVLKRQEDLRRRFYSAKYEGSISLLECLEYTATSFLKNNPGYIKKYPFLHFGYHKDGTKKSTLKLLKDRDCLILQNKKLKNEIDDLYKSLIVTRGFLFVKHTQEEYYDLSKIIDYMKKNNKNDIFYKELLHQKEDKITQDYAEMLENSNTNFFRK